MFMRENYICPQFFRRVLKKNTRGKMPNVQALHKAENCLPEQIGAMIMLGPQPQPSTGGPWLARHPPKPGQGVGLLRGWMKQQRFFPGCHDANRN